MRWFVSYKDGPSFEVSADKASEFIDFFGKKYRDDTTGVDVKDRQVMTIHSFYDREFNWISSVIGIIIK